MSYYIDIIDTKSDLVQIVDKNASANGIVLDWNGSDSKDEMAIVASKLTFDMLTLNDADAVFIDFFTGDEHRFKAVIKDSADDSIVWQGHILPDSYEEPYKAVNFFVRFVATDGLGRLKGKYLSNEFYSREKSLIDIFCQILRLTGLELELYFSPAIENASVKNWHQIYIDTESFFDNKKKKDAYKILEQLLNDTLCVCYQADNRWYIEGINVRQMRKVTYKNYDAVGNLLGTVAFDRTLKQITPAPTPTITMIPPYNEIIISHKKTMPEIPKTASKEKNDGWVVTTGGGNGIIDCSEWMGNGNYFAKAVTPNYNVVLYNQYFFDNVSGTTHAQDNTKFISLRKKIFLTKTDKVKFVLDLNIVNPATGNQGNVSTWNNVLKYEIIFNNEVLYSNFGALVEDRENLIFSTSGDCKVQIEHFFAANSPDGLLDIRLYRPIGRVLDNGVLGVSINEVSVEIIGFVDEVIETDLINGDFTIDKNLELEYAEDKSGFSNGFRLAKIKEQTAFYNEIEVYILYGITFNNKFYSVVLIEGANLIKENLYQVSYSGNPIEIIDVIYNFNNGPEMVVETRTPITSGSFFVKKYAVGDVLENRSHWTQWSDTFFKIETNSYVKTVANVYRRMFNVAHEKIELTARNAVKFNDIVLFNYVYLKDFVVLNTTWNLDTNQTNLVLGKCNYSDGNTTNPELGNVPPIVVAGDDVYILEGNTGVQLSAQAYDPDGFIVSQVWTKIAGDNDAIIVSPESLTPSVIDLAGDFYTFQVLVTDNQGATAVDTVNVVRVKNYTISLNLINSNVYNLPYKSNQPGLYNQKDIYQLVVTPELPANAFLLLKGKMYLYARSDYNNAKSGGVIQSLSSYTIEKNGGFVEGNQIQTKGFVSSRFLKTEIPLELSYVAGDAVLVNLVVQRGPVNQKSGNGYFKAKANVKLQISNINTNVGVVVGLPFEKELKIYDPATTATRPYTFYERPDL